MAAIGAGHLEPPHLGRLIIDGFVHCGAKAHMGAQFMLGRDTLEIVEQDILRRIVHRPVVVWLEG